MKEFIEKLKAAIMAESYEDRAGRSVISVKSALEAIDRVAAEQPATYDVEAICRKLFLESEEVCGSSMVELEAAKEIIRSGGI